jgi:hypothetical protein
VRQLAPDDPGDDLGVAVRMLVEAGAGREPLLVAGDQRAEAEVVRVVVGPEGEAVTAVDPGRRIPAPVALVGAPYVHHTHHGSPAGGRPGP